MDESIKICEVIIADHYAVISGLMHQLHVHEHHLNNKTAAWADIEESYMRHVINMQQECAGMCLVAYDDELPVGFIFGYAEDQDDSRIEIHEGKELYVSDGYVLETHRRKGIYRSLNQRLESHYIKQGVKRIIRFTLFNNVGMRQFLEDEEYVVTRFLYEKWL